MLAYVDGPFSARAAGGDRKHHARLEFLSIPVTMPTGAVYLAQRARVPIVMGVTVREGRRSWPA